MDVGVVAVADVVVVVETGVAAVAVLRAVVLGAPADVPKMHKLIRHR